MAFDIGKSWGSPAAGARISMEPFKKQISGAGIGGALFGVPGALAGGAGVGGMIGEGLSGAGRAMGTWFGGSDIAQGQQELAQAQAGIGPRYAQMAGYSQQMEPHERMWAGHQQALEQKFQNDIKSLNAQANAQALDARAAYTNTIRPGMMDIMENARSEAGSAMTLAQAQDPNNPVAQAYRNFYGQQAAGTQQAGLATAGAMQALGAQALAGQLGGGAPVTGGQMQALQAGYGAQAGGAMAQTQRQMERLRQQGLEQGWLQTQMAYGRGQAAKDSYRQSLGDIQGAQQTFLAGQQGLRGEQAGYAGGMRESRMGQGRAAYESRMAPLMRQMGMTTQRGAEEMGLAGARAQMEAGEAAGKSQMWGGVLGGLARGLPAMMG